jgi:proteasome lid subunit RPN8/RPN11
VRLVPGRSHIDSSHEIVKRHPDHFEIALDRTSQARARDLIRLTSPVQRPPAPPRDDLGRERWRLVGGSDECVFRDRAISPTRVRLAQDARRELLAILAATTEHDRKEAGGLLLGSIRDGLAEIVSVSGPGPRAARAADEYRPDVPHDLAIAARERAIGAWHCHPGGTRAPSSEDLTAFACWRRDVLDSAELVQLIAVPSRAGSWTFEAFTTRRGFERDVTERASLR